MFVPGLLLLLLLLLLLFYAVACCVCLWCAALGGVSLGGGVGWVWGWLGLGVFPSGLGRVLGWLGLGNFSRGWLGLEFLSGVGRVYLFSLFLFVVIGPPVLFVVIDGSR